MGVRAEVVPLTTTWRDHFRPPESTEIVKVWLTGSRVHAALSDGRELAAPVSWLLLCLNGEEAEGAQRPGRTRIVRADLWDPDRLRVDLEDGRSVWVPWSWFPILQKASRYQRVAGKIWGAGSCLVWDELNTEVCLERQILGVFGNAQLPETGSGG
jgi:hypothetical protein